MNWFKKITGIYDKRQQARTNKVTEIVHKKKRKFASDIKKLNMQAKIIHSQATKTTKESAKLVIMVEDITTKIAIATGGFKDK